MRYAFSSVLLEYQAQWDQDAVVPYPLCYQVLYKMNRDSPTSGRIKSVSYLVPSQGALSINYVFKALSAYHQKLSIETQS